MNATLGVVVCEELVVLVAEHQPNIDEGLRIMGFLPCDDKSLG